MKENRETGGWRKEEQMEDGGMGKDGKTGNRNKRSARGICIKTVRVSEGGDGGRVSWPGKVANAGTFGRE